jgi:hypothetical protein
MTSNGKVETTLVSYPDNLNYSGKQTLFIIPMGNHGNNTLSPFIDNFGGGFFITRKYKFDIKLRICIPPANKVWWGI